MRLNYRLSTLFQTGILVIILCASIIHFLPVPTVNADPAPIEMNVTTTEVFPGTGIINGSIYIQNGGTLYIQNAHLYMNGSSAPINITIFFGGTLYILDSIIEPYDSGSTYYIINFGSAFIVNWNSICLQCDSSYACRKRFTVSSKTVCLAWRRNSDGNYYLSDSS